MNTGPDNEFRVQTHDFLLGKCRLQVEPGPTRMDPGEPGLDRDAKKSKFSDCLAEFSVY